MLKKFNEFVSENLQSEVETSLELLYYSFDWDDNILHMPTVIHMDKNIGDEWIPTDVSTSEFAQVRNDKDNYRLIDNDPAKAFSEFRDSGPRGEEAFLIDVKTAINNGDFGPSWDAFIKCLSNGSIFSIITARGHEPQTIRKAIEYIIDEVLSEDEKNLLYNNCLKHTYIFDKADFDRIPKGQLSKTALITKYLDYCDYYGVSSDTFAKEFGSASASNPEKAKEIALDAFVEKCKKFGTMIGTKSIAIGFSDDDPKNVEHVHKYFKEKSALTNNLKLNLYNTNDRNVKGGIRTKFYGEGHDPLASSVLPFTQFNNMADRLNPKGPHHRQDDYLNQKNRQVYHLNKVSREILDKKKKGIKKRSI
jgi:hypothetical protein